MVEDILDEIRKQYSVTLNEAESNTSVKFVTVVEKGKDPKVVSLQYVDNQLYSVTFINNEFFELTKEDLATVIMAILEGNYIVKRPLFRRPFIVIQRADGRKILPERLQNKHLTLDDIGLYKALPEPFTPN